MALGFSTQLLLTYFLQSFIHSLVDAASNDIYMQYYNFSYLAKDLPPPILNCTMCFVGACEHAAVWVEARHHNKSTCYRISNLVAMLFHQLDACNDGRDYKETICSHVSKGGIATTCHSNLQCFEKEIYDAILDCISPQSAYYSFDQLFPECLNHHEFASSLKYREKQMVRANTEIILREWKQIVFF
mmetsp:Transcript_39632/g.63406  ORF Transcript_39632/g.63406 Transcript_39632/m.63406 type:complete len:187 (+) Transcript_39632:38-598(+)